MWTTTTQNMQEVELQKKILNENKTLTYLFGAFLIFAITNLTLIYNFFKILGNFV